MKKVILILVCTSILLALPACSTVCSHEWKIATCLSPKTCTLCGVTEGDPTGHNWKKATCTSAKKCQLCEVTEGYPTGHNWKKATCTSAQKCQRCGTTVGLASGHNYVNGVCSNCGAEDPNYVADYGVAYICQRKTQYESDTNEYIVFFGLMDENEKLLSASGEATISISDGSSTLYQSVIEFTESDFSMWTNSSWETNKLLCGLRIPYSKINKGSNSKGVLNLRVELKDGTYFANSEISISNLPIDTNSSANIQEVLSNIERYPNYLKIQGEILLLEVERYRVAGNETSKKIVKDMIETVSTMKGYLQKIIEECEPYDKLYPLVLQCEIDIPVFAGDYNSYVSDVKLFATRCTRIQSIYDALLSQ